MICALLRVIPKCPYRTQRPVLRPSNSPTEKYASWQNSRHHLSPSSYITSARLLLKLLRNRGPALSQASHRRNISDPVARRSSDGCGTSPARASLVPSRTDISTGATPRAAPPLWCLFLLRAIPFKEGLRPEEVAAQAFRPGI